MRSYDKILNLNRAKTTRNPLNLNGAKFHHYLIENDFKFFMDHQALKYLVNKPILQGNIFRWILLFQEFEFDVIIQPGRKNVRPDHLSQLEIGEDSTCIDDDLLDAHLFRVKDAPKDLENIVNLLEEGKAPEDLPTNKNKFLSMKVSPFTIIKGYLYKMGMDDVLRRCVPENE
jgi:hypothetical protein